MIISIIELFGGLIYLLIGGDLLVRGAVALSRRARISPMIIGLTLVAMGTSAPELVVSVGSVLTGHTALALGNVVGSNITNVLLVVGLPALVAPLLCDNRTVRSDTAFMLATSFLFVLLCANGVLGRLDGFILLTGVLVFLAYSVRSAREEPDLVAGAAELERGFGLPARRRMIALLIVLGVIALPVGAELMIVGAVDIASRLGVSEAVVGLTIVAVGTSLPELATTSVAAFQRQADVAMGNVLGSNVFNLIGIMGAATLLSPSAIAVPAPFLRLDLPVMLAAALVLSWFTMRRARIGRPVGILLVTGYVLYVIALFEPGVRGA
ncbi:MAG: calcium/sodium antiporter [Gemmatimonadetes bacterium]|nr:calcium/sodium antiporter [Gemmatimonadota bacterium]